MKEHPSLKLGKQNTEEEIHYSYFTPKEPIVEIESPKELREIKQKVAEQDQKLDLILTLLQKKTDNEQLRKELLEENLKVTQAMNAILARELKH